MMNRCLEILARKRNDSGRIPRPFIFPDKGFTLIELLVVIAIIALLVSILLPSLTKAKELAKLTVCATNERSIGASAHMYMSDFDGQIFHCVPAGNPWGKGLPWNRLLLEKGYLGDTAVLRCPAHSRVDTNIEDKNLRSYIVNAWITSELGSGYYLPQSSSQLNVDSLPNDYYNTPAETNLLYDMWRCYGGGNNTVRDNTNYDECDENLCWLLWMNNATGKASHMQDNLVNFLFLDGHVAAYENLFTGLPYPDPTSNPRLLYGWYFYPW